MRKADFWRVVLLEDKAIVLKALRKFIGSALLSIGKPYALIEKLGIEPGSVPPVLII